MSTSTTTVLDPSATGGLSDEEEPQGRTWSELVRHGTDTAWRWLEIQPLTLLWCVVFGGSLAGLMLLAGPRMDLVVMMMGYAGLVLCTLSLVTVVPTALALWAAVRNVETGTIGTTDAMTPIRTGVSLPNFTWLPLLQMEWTWLTPEGATVRLVRVGWRRHEEVTFPERGRFDRLVRRYTVSDVLGLARVRWQQPIDQTLTVLPHTGSLRQMPIIEAFQSGDQLPHPSGKPEGGRYELRRYTYGQSARHIVWKIYGRNRRLMVREPERAISRSINTAAYLIAADNDEASAAAARVAIESGVLGDAWLFGTDGVTDGATRQGPALEAIARSAHHRDKAGTGLQGFMDRALDRGFNRCLTFAPGRTGPWVDRVISLSAEWPGGMEVIIGIDDFNPAPKAPTWWRHLLWGHVAMARDLEGVDELLEATQRLTRAGIKTMVIDRAAGRPIALELLRRRSET
ncbi:MAG: DUF58 domain-containing protein [Myxococcota bacterium]